MSRCLHLVFGAPAQVVVGLLMVAATTAQTVYWLSLAAPPSKTAIFIVSMEALYFAAYAVIATALAVMWLNERTPDA